jgi:hypothetical protein
MVQGSLKGIEAASSCCGFAEGRIAITTTAQKNTNMNNKPQLSANALSI